MSSAPLRVQPAVGIETVDCMTLPLSEILGGDRRLEAGSYLSPGFVVRHRTGLANCQVAVLGSLGSVWQPSRLKGIQVEPGHGVPFIAATQAFDIWPTPRKWIAPDKTPNLQSRYVEPDWILVTCSGTVGQAILTYAAHAGLVISHDLLRVEIAKPKLRSYVYAFLRTWYGRAMMRASHYGNVIKHLEVSHLKKLPVPILDRLLDETHRGVLSVFSARDEAHQLDMSSRAMFAAAMEDQPEIVSEQGYIVPASQLFGGRRRLEASAQSPNSRFVSQVYERNSDSVVALHSVARVSLPGRFKRIYGEQGVAFLDSEPVFKINPEVTKFLTPATNIDLDAYTVRRGWLLMARSGQTYGINGQVILASEGAEQKVITEDIIRIVPSKNRVRSGYLQAVLSHPKLGQPLIVSQAFGTSIPHLAPKDIEQLPVPRLDCELEDDIADAAERANDLRRGADEKENAVVAKLELALSGELGMSPGKQHHGPLQSPNVA